MILPQYFSVTVLLTSQSARWRIRLVYFRRSGTEYSCPPNVFVSCRKCDEINCLISLYTQASDPRFLPTENLFIFMKITQTIKPKC